MLTLHEADLLKAGSFDDVIEVYLLLLFAVLARLRTHSIAVPLHAPCSRHFMIIAFVAGR